ncbi:hypothetical protein GP486_005878 [Trichoglossum hirsutum]|uniref:Uncharacterized protein n=1 Tax=Trichoglossum hirsutum TaxID=265104 RepID=A0A9P8L8H6_9PEZI|nr:hypothetical protein GP486_005878 [Trichoglossum hirsutum]
MSEEYIRGRERIFLPRRTWHGRRIREDYDDRTGRYNPDYTHVHSQHHHNGKRHHAVDASHYLRTIFSGSGLLAFVVWAVKQSSIGSGGIQQAVNVLDATGFGNDIAMQNLVGGNLANQVLLLILCHTNSNVDAAACDQVSRQFPVSNVLESIVSGTGKTSTLQAPSLQKGGGLSPTSIAVILVAVLNVFAGTGIWLSTSRNRKGKKVFDPEYGRKDG